MTNLNVGEVDQAPALPESAEAGFCGALSLHYRLIQLSGIPESATDSHGAEGNTGEATVLDQTLSGGQCRA